METYLYKLKFKGPTHFGETGIDLENVRKWVSSDTLFSALVNAAKDFYSLDHATNLSNRFKCSNGEEPPFYISSLFPYKKDDEFYLPKPLDDSQFKEEYKKKYSKKLKKIKWLSLENYLKWLEGHEWDDKVLDKMGDTTSDVCEEVKRPRVTLDRTTQDSTIYFCGFVHFEENAGLYGMVAFRDKTEVADFKILLNCLGENGLGGEKTYGCGRFEVECFEEVSGTLKDVLEKERGRYTLLSLYHPDEAEEEELSENLIAYDLVRKRGWISSGRYTLPFKRNSVGFITEGSVLKSPPKGKLVDVKPTSLSLEHNVYRYGFAFTAPFRRFK